jgi:serine protease AprX
MRPSATTTWRSELSGSRTGRLQLVFCAMMVALYTSLASVPPATSAAAAEMVNVVVRGAAGAMATVENSVREVGGRVTTELGLIDGVAAKVPANRVSSLSGAPGVEEVTPDSSVHLLSGTYDPTTDMGSAYNTTRMIGARALWQAGYTGKGVDVAIIDSGVSPVEGLATSDKLMNGPDLSFESQATNLRYLDAFGHGTFMAGLIAGRDSAAVPGTYAGDTTHFLGVAPDARILNVKVADSQGLTDVSQVLAALSWVVQHRYDNGLNVRVLNLSFGSDSYQSEILDPMSFAVEHAWKSGIVVVASVGNAGWKSGGVMDPAFNPYVIAAGASDPHGTLGTADDTVAAFSSFGDGVRNPDLVAPGKSVQSLRVPGSYIDQTYAATGAIDARFFRGSGTSEAAAITSGTVALLLQQYPSASPDQIKAMLTSTATHLTGQAAAGQGHGEINASKASHAGPPLLAIQLFLPATGLGSIESSRGSVHLAWSGVNLAGEKDIFGTVLSSSNLVGAILHDVAWSGGTFNGNSWSGNSWSGNSWSGNSWSGNSWSGNSWSGNSWSGNSWSGNSWSGNSWSGNSWSGNSWSGNSWSSASWQ